MEEGLEELKKTCRLGDVTALQECLAKHPQIINECDPKLGWTELYRSVVCGQINVVEALLKAKADPNIRTKMGDTALHRAASNKQREIARLLLGFKADSNIQQNDGETALHQACIEGDFKMAKLLLQHKANANVQDYVYGKSPLHYAVDFCYASIVGLLIQYHANTDLIDRHGKSPKDLARTSEIQSLLGVNSFYIPSPEPSEIPQKSSLEYVSPSLSRSNSEFSLYSENKPVEHKIKQLEDIHKKIREAVRVSVDTVKTPNYSHNASLLVEPDAEKTGYDIIVDRNKAISFGGTERNPELYNWLCKAHLEELYTILLGAGYDDLKQLSYQMSSNLPITEMTLKEIGIMKSGLRKRFLLALDGLAYKKERRSEPAPNPFKCCTVGNPASGWMLNIPDLGKWLESLNLKELYQNFLDNGYEELEEMLLIMNSPWEITADDLRLMGIGKPGHRHRILSKLKEDATGFEYVNNRKKRDLTIDKEFNSSACELCRVF
ncbi:hypothetical protein SteCoe_32763 [Stentor coeruleus]|uniref:NAD(+) ADP-ribosyltransferase n=1 Tax=Stentor coeruleus TaxID=5963 RepID=A0A1R2AYB3_9CILI|nr:hypothetical protein SteCoe_32763 [Stentor coeruleus]